MTSGTVFFDSTNRTQIAQNDSLKRRAETDCEHEGSGKRAKSSIVSEEEDRDACDEDVEVSGEGKAEVHLKVSPRDLFSSLRALRMGNPVARRTFTCGFSLHRFCSRILTQYVQYRPPECWKHSFLHTKQICTNATHFRRPHSLLFRTPALSAMVS